jgi:Putative secretion activating protein
MADFNEAIKPVLQYEGGYVNDPDDNGGETYKGISRKFWPRWTGWQFIDVAKKQAGFPASLSKISGLQDSVLAFYRDNFWKPIGGDAVEHGEVAGLILDSAVNEGISTAVRRAQGICGFMPTGRVTPDLITKLNSLV